MKCLGCSPLSGGTLAFPLLTPRNIHLSTLLLLDNNQYSAFKRWGRPKNYI
jgi:hypothetical protein